jgi:hypothetical protein
LTLAKSSPRILQTRFFCAKLNLPQGLRWVLRRVASIGIEQEATEEAEGDGESSFAGGASGTPASTYRLIGDNLVLRA